MVARAERAEGRGGDDQPCVRPPARSRHARLLALWLPRLSSDPQRLNSRPARAPRDEGVRAVVARARGAPALRAHAASRREGAEVPRSHGVHPPSCTSIPQPRNSPTASAIRLAIRPPPPLSTAAVERVLRRPSQRHLAPVHRRGAVHGAQGVPAEAADPGGRRRRVRAALRRARARVGAPLHQALAVPDRVVRGGPRRRAEDGGAEAQAQDERARASARCSSTCTSARSSRTSTTRRSSPSRSTTSCCCCRRGRPRTRTAGSSRSPRASSSARRGSRVSSSTASASSRRRRSGTTTAASP